jgi:S-adenosylmethionine:tRNA-ribosyltransferase-isomerase (queuine synthetase)
MKNILKSISMMIYAMIVFILIAVFVNSKSRIAEFDKMIDIFEKSDNIIFINSKIDDYISNHLSRSKQSIMHTMINTLINRKRIKSTIDMRNRLIDDNQITMEIVEMEMETINNDIISYRNKLYEKLNAISELENKVIISNI